jgi:hypothetical protein
LKEPKAKKCVHGISGERPFAATAAGYMDMIGKPRALPAAGFSLRNRRNCRKAPGRVLPSAQSTESEMKEDGKAAADAMARAVQGMTVAHVVDGAIILITTLIGTMRTEHGTTPEETEVFFETICKDIRATLVARGHLPPSLSH